MIKKKPTTISTISKNPKKEKGNNHFETETEPKHYMVETKMNKTWNSSIPWPKIKGGKKEFQSLIFTPKREAEEEPTSFQPNGNGLLLMIPIYFSKILKETLPFLLLHIHMPSKLPQTYHGLPTVRTWEERASAETEQVLLAKTVLKVSKMAGWSKSIVCSKNQLKTNTNWNQLGSCIIIGNHAC